MRYRFEPAIFALAPLDKKDWRWHLTSAFSKRLRKYTFTAVHTKTHRLRFQIYPLWRAFFNLCVYGESFHRLRVDGRPKRIKKFAFTIVFVWTGPKSELEIPAACDVFSTWSRFARDQFPLLMLVKHLIVQMSGRSGPVAEISVFLTDISGIWR